MRCPHCRFDIPSSGKFCEECGVRLQSRFEAAEAAEVFGSPPRQSSEKDELDHVARFAGERRCVTVLLFDLSDYFAFSVTPDLEQIHGIAKRVFDENPKSQPGSIWSSKKDTRAALMAILDEASSKINPL